MILRFIIENFLSFKEPTEFNLLPSSKSTHLCEHKMKVSHAQVLRMTAIYGPNGAGKSNLIKSIKFFSTLVRHGAINISEETFRNKTFRFQENNFQKPISFAIEFYTNSQIYYYTLSFIQNKILAEELYISKKNSDQLVFRRNLEKGKQKIKFANQFAKESQNKTFTAVIQNKLLNENMLLISFMAENYPKEIPDIANAYQWIIHHLIIITPTSFVGALAHLMDTNKEMLDLVNTLLPETNIGLNKLTIIRNVIDEKDPALNNEWKSIINELKQHPNKPMSLSNNFDERIHASIIFENGEIVLKQIVPVHIMENGKEIMMDISEESDGTIRLLEYIPFIYDILHNDSVYIVDEIERSMHPILIKEIIERISKKPSTSGQLVFTTHESCLLNQKILRPDEIWFAEKDLDQSTKLYPLSDFNIHSTANIENGYLNGRYGAIPFLSNLKDLNW